VGKQVGTTKHAPCTHMSATEQMAHNLSTPYRGMSVIKFSKNYGLTWSILRVSSKSKH